MSPPPPPYVCVHCGNTAFPPCVTQARTLYILLPALHLLTRNAGFHSTHTRPGYLGLQALGKVEKSHQDEAVSDRRVSVVKREARVWRKRLPELGGPFPPVLNQPQQKGVRYRQQHRGYGPVLKSTGLSRTQQNLSSSIHPIIRKARHRAAVCALHTGKT